MLKEPNNCMVTFTDAFNIVQKQTKETLGRIMTLRCLGIGFTYRGAKLYNSIAKDIRDTGNVNVFQKRIFKYPLIHR